LEESEELPEGVTTPEVEEVEVEELEDAEVISKSSSLPDPSSLELPHVAEGLEELEELEGLDLRSTRSLDRTERQDQAELSSTLSKNQSFISMLIEIILDNLGMV